MNALPLRANLGSERAAPGQRSEGNPLTHARAILVCPRGWPDTVQRPTVKALCQSLFAIGDCSSPVRLPFRREVRRPWSVPSAPDRGGFRPEL